MNDEKMHWFWEFNLNKNRGVFAATAIEREFIKCLKKNLWSSFLKKYPLTWKVIKFIVTLTSHMPISKTLDHFGSSGTNSLGYLSL